MHEHNEDNMTPPKTLKALREENGFTQASLAAAIGTYGTQVASWEGGVGPTAPWIPKLAKVFKVTPTEIRASIAETKRQAQAKAVTA